MIKLNLIGIKFELILLINLLTFALFHVQSFVLKHHNNRELNNELQLIQQKCSDISRIYELNYRSVRGWPLTVIEFSDNPGKHDFCKYREISL